MTTNSVPKETDMSMHGLMTTLALSLSLTDNVREAFPFLAWYIVWEKTAPGSGVALPRQVGSSPRVGASYNPGTKMEIPRADTVPHGIETQPRWLIADWLGLLGLARGENCRSGQRRGPAAPGVDKFPSPDQKSFQISTTLTTRGQKRRSPGSIPLRTVWKP